MGASSDKMHFPAMAVARTRGRLDHPDCGCPATLAVMPASRRSPNAGSDENSRRTRVQVVFGWLAAHGEPDWPARLVTLADGLGYSGEVEMRPAGAPSASAIAVEQRLLVMLEPVLVANDD